LSSLWGGGHLPGQVLGHAGHSTPQYSDGIAPGHGVDVQDLAESTETAASGGYQYVLWPRRAVAG